MKGSSKPPKQASDTDTSNSAPDAAEIEALCADVARCFTWPDRQVDRGVITDGQRRVLERVLMAILTAGTDSGPRDDQKRDLVRRILLTAAKPAPVQALLNLRRDALIRSMPELRRVLEGPSDLDAASELAWIDICRNVRRLDPKARPLTRAIAERALDPSDNRTAERLAVALGMFGDKDPATARERFDSAVSALSRGKPRKPRKAPARVDREPTRRKPRKAHKRKR